MSENVSEPGLDPSIPHKNFLDRMAERLGSSAQAEAVYGAPVERDGVTVIPVAKVRYGFGGGDGSTSGDGAVGMSGGSGGGGGVAVSPLGYIEIVDGNSRFRRINDPAALLPVVVAGGLTALLLLRGLRKMVR